MSVSHFDIVWLCFTSHRPQGYFEKAPKLFVPCKEREALFLYQFPPRIEPWVVAWQSITLPLPLASSFTFWENRYNTLLPIWKYMVSQICNVINQRVKNAAEILKAEICVAWLHTPHSLYKNITSFKPTKSQNCLILSDIDLKNKFAIKCY